MKHYISVIILLFVSFIFISSTSFFANADETFSVDAYGAIANDELDDTYAMNSALRSAAVSSSSSTVIIPPGTYHLSDELKIFPNTTLIAEGATLLFDYVNGGMLRGAHFNSYGNNCHGESCEHFGYSQCHDVTVTGGSWIWNISGFPEESYGVMHCFSFKHANNITIKNLMCKGASKHFINVSSSKNVLIDGVTLCDAQTCNDPEAALKEFVDAPVTEKYYTTEAVHTDICNGDGEWDEYAMPLDKTPPKNITVKNCTFSNVYTGVGNHHHTDGERPSDITVENCSFDGIMSYCVFSYDFDNLTLKNNTCVNSSAFANILNSKDVVVQNNSFSGAASPAVNRSIVVVKDHSEAEITGNTFKINPVFAVSVGEGSSVSISSNTVSDVVRAFNIESSCAAITNNDISKTGDVGVVCTNSNNCLIESNTIVSSTGRGIVDKACYASNIKDNSISGMSSYGISLKNSKAAVISGNTISTKGAAIRTDGENQENLCECRIENNSLLSSESYDLLIADYSSVYLSENILGNYNYKISSNAVYDGSLVSPSFKSVSLSEETFIYDGKEKCPSVTVYDSFDRVLTQGTHYSVAYKSNINAGEAYLTVTGKGIFKDQSIKKTFTILPVNVVPQIVLSNTSYKYNGEVKTPSAVVYNGEQILDSSQYSIKYDSGRKNAGTYQVTVTLKKNYSGESSASFTIKPKSIEPVVMLSSSKYIYNGSKRTPGVKVFDEERELSSSYYTVSFGGACVLPGKYNVKVVLKNNYSGSKTVSYNIVPHKVGGLKKVSVSEKSVKISWKSLTEASAYSLQQSSDEKTWIEIGKFDNTTATVKSLKPGTKYYFRVIALDSSLKISGEPSNSLELITKPKAPVISSVKSTKSNTAVVTWAKVKGATSYIVYTSKDSINWKKAVTTENLKCTLKNLPGGKKTYVKIVAVNALNIKSNYSEVSSVKIKK